MDLTNFNWLDLAIIVFLILSLIRGCAVGFIHSAFTILGLAAGFFTAVRYYAFGSNLLLRFVDLPQPVSDLISFALIFILLSSLVQLLSLFFSAVTRFRAIRIADRIGGAVAGVLIGLTITGIILTMLTSFPLLAAFQDHVEQSGLAPVLMDSSRSIYENVVELLPLELPSLAFYPEQLLEQYQYSLPLPDPQDLDFQQLDGAGCFVCPGQVQFLGYLTNDFGSTSPKFRCTSCGRTSDGCQTYEGHHLMYGTCPVVLGRQGYRFDCGIWRNGSYHRPTGTCPVCGQRG